jgi:hypothetical protein
MTSIYDKLDMSSIEIRDPILNGDKTFYLSKLRSNGETLYIQSNKMKLFQRRDKYLYFQVNKTFSTQMNLLLSMIRRFIKERSVDWFEYSIKDDNFVSVLRDDVLMTRVSKNVEVIDENGEVKSINDLDDSQDLKIIFKLSNIVYRKNSVEIRFELQKVLVMKKVKISFVDDDNSDVESIDSDISYSTHAEDVSEVNENDNMCDMVSESDLDSEFKDISIVKDEIS